MTIKVNSIFFFNFDTLESGIDLGQGINVEPGKFGKKNKHKALNLVLTNCKKNTSPLFKKAVGVGPGEKNPN